MSDKKSTLFINKIFSLSFIITFSLLLIFIISKGYVNERDSNTYNCTLNERFCIILAFIIFAASAFVVYYSFNRTINRFSLLRRIDKKLYVPLFILTACGFMFVLQLAAGYLLACKPVTDVSIIDMYSSDFAKHGNYNLVKTGFMDYYLVKYQNNFLLLFILSFLYRLSYLINGYIPIYLPIFINALAINISVVLTVFLTRKLFGDRKAVFTLLLCLIFAPFYTYAVFYYTDSLSMPLLIGSVYLFVYAFNEKNLIKKISLLCLCGGFLFFSFKLKGSIAILIVGILVYLFAKLSFKRAVVIAFAVLIGIGLTSYFYNSKLSESNIVTPELSERYEYPYTHWVMLGLKGYGHYNHADSEFTHSFSNKELKKSANMEMIKRRIGKYGVKGTVKHLVKKAVWTWEDGTYYISHHISNPIHKNKLHSYVLQNGSKHFIFYEYSCAFQLFIILMMILSAVKSFKNPELNFNSLIRLIIFGAFIFFLIWETRSRYLYNFTPLFILLTVDGLFSAGGFLRQKSRLLSRL
jgi:4-amino-4-deoxy-L-arabinose transferase-like glycosyltransferase